MLPDLVDLRRAAALLTCSPRTVERLAAQRKVSAYRVGRRLRFDMRDLERYLRANYQRADLP